MFITCIINGARIQILMAKKKSVKDLIAEAKERLENNKKQCEGCFGPRNNIITKWHMEKTWLVKDITIGENRVILPCLVCKTPRELSLGSVSLAQFRTESQLYNTVALIKDGKYNVLVGIGTPKSTDLTGFI